MCKQSGVSFPTMRTKRSVSRLAKQERRTNLFGSVRDRESTRPNQGTSLQLLMKMIDWHYKIPKLLNGKPAFGSYRALQRSSSSPGKSSKELSLSVKGLWKDLCPLTLDVNDAATLNLSLISSSLPICSKGLATSPICK